MYPYHHPHAQRILELPVYRCTEEQYYREQDANYECVAQDYERILQRFSHMPESPPEWMKGFRPESVAERMKAFRIEWKLYPWDFNEVVGWIRLYVRAGSIGASLFVVNTKISKNMARKKFVWETSNFIELSVSEGQTSADIFNVLRSNIIAENLRRFKGKRYVDTGVLDILGPHLNWVILTHVAPPALP
jgi:hypothetical protein